MQKEPKKKTKQSIKFGIFAKILLALFIVSLIPVTVLTFLTITTYQGIIDKYLPLEEPVVQELSLTQHNVKIQVFLIAFLVVILTVFSAILVSRYFFRPIRRLVKGTREISAGNLDFKIEISSQDELGLLGQSFNQMTKDLKKSRFDLELEKNKVEAVIESLVDGLIVFGLSSKIIFVNPAAEKILGVSTRKAQGKKINSLRLSKELVPLVDFVLDRLKRKSLTAVQTELTMRISSDKRIIEEKIFQATSIPVKSQKLWGLAVILHDITREKLIDQMKTEFVSLAAHQLRTPLSAVKWALKMLVDGDLGRLSKDQKDFIGRSYDTNERMIALVNDLLNVTRIEEGRFGYEFIETDFLDFINKIFLENQDAFGAKRLSFELFVPEKKLPKVRIDPEKIKLALQNILDNAKDYTPSGGKVTLGLGKKDKCLQVSVKDTGVGIPENQMSRLFGKFFRASNIIKLQTEGNGLGLFITKNIIEKHSGKIWAESKLDQGSTFYFTIPIK